MSGQKLKASHKIAAFLERMLRDIRVRDMEVAIPAVSQEIPSEIRAYVIDESVALNCDLVEMDTGFGSSVHSMGALSVDEITGISLKSFTTESVDIELKSITATTVEDENLRIDAVALDYCDSDSFRIKYKTRVRPIDFSGFSATVNWLNPLIYSKVKDNLFLIRKLKVRHSAVNMSYVGEKTQLKFWKKAVITTRKDPKKLELKGFFYGVPVDSIEKLAYDGMRGVLLYSYTQNYRKGVVKVKDVAVFHDVEKNERVVIID